MFAFLLTGSHITGSIGIEVRDMLPNARSEHLSRSENPMGELSLNGQAQPFFSSIWEMLAIREILTGGDL
jgi:hypothetical protein